jgi:hypothetical protein
MTILKEGDQGALLSIERVITVLNLRVMSGHFFFESYSSEKSKHCSDGVVR